MVQLVVLSIEASSADGIVRRVPCVEILSVSNAMNGTSHHI